MGNIGMHKPSGRGYEGCIGRVIADMKGETQHGMGGDDVGCDLE